MSADSIWQAIRTHYGFQSTGAHFIEVIDIKLQPEDLYHRLMAFDEDGFLLRGVPITHYGENFQEEEELSSSLENLVVLLWLRLNHKDLPRLMKQHYGTEFQSKTLASIKPEISQVLDSLTDEVLTFQDAKTMRSAAQSSRPFNNPAT